MMPVAILCGGKGTRLSPLTDQRPKSLVDVIGQPFIRHQLDLLKRYGYTEIVLLVGHLGHAIEAALGDGSSLGMHIRYSYDETVGAGTDAAIIHARPLLGEAFFVLYGDSYLDCDYGAIEAAFRSIEQDALLLMYGGVDWGLRAFRVFPPRSWIELEMNQPFQEIGSHDGLAAVCAALSHRNTSPAR